MGLLTEEDKLRIKNIAEEFTVQSIGSEIPTRLCFSICYPLSLFLAIKGVKNSLKQGHFKTFPHFWLNLKDDKGTILDPTIRQFDERMESVYIGKITENYNPDSRPFKDWFKGVYRIWAEPLLDKPYTHKRPQGFKEKAILDNLKAATILNTEIEQMVLKKDFMECNPCKLYFSPINKALLNKWHNDRNFINRVTLLLPKGFDNLLSKAISSENKMTATN